MEIEAQIRTKIRSAIEYHGLTPTTLAAKTGITRQTVTRVLRLGICDVRTLDRICDGLGLKIKIEK